MKKLLLLLPFLALPAIGQNAVFNQFSPSVIGMTIGTSHCYMWGNLTPPYTLIVGCYTASGIQQVQAQVAGQELTGFFCDSVNFAVLPGKCVGNSFAWLVTPNGAGGFWQIFGSPASGTTNFQQGNF